MRLTRVGGKKDPVWRVVVADRRSPRDGRVIETIGRYNAQTEPSTVVLDEERVKLWLSRGAQPSDTVRSLFQHTGIMDKFAKVRQGKATAETAGKVVAWKKKKPKIHKVKKEELAKAKAAEAAAATAAAAASATAAAADAAPAA